ncbi:MAG: cytidine deaminase [Bacilli bacterium]|nr:cytidine deaminase [Bacilli bacterium]
MNKLDLIEMAKKARKLSYSPYSEFKVGAAVLCKDGEVYVGSNVENASYGLCMCAERNALYNALMHGKKKEDFVMFAVVADTEGPCSPCGACRQVLQELYPSEAPIYCANLSGDIKETNVEELLPFSFRKDDLK